MSLDKYIQDGQEPKIIEKLFNKVQSMLEANEQISYIAVQKKPAVTLLPDSIMISNKRIFLCEFTKLGLSMNFEIFHWREIKDIAFKEEIFGSKVTVIPFTGENLSIDYIPKAQARKLFQFIKEALQQFKSISAQNTGNQESKSTKNNNTPQQAAVTASSNATQAQKTVAPVQANTPKSEAVVATSVERKSNTIEIPSVPTFVTEEAPVQKTTITTPVTNPIQTPNPAVLPTTMDSAVEDELTQRLRKLKSLYDKQLITQAEYEGKKAEILSQI